MKKYKDFVPGPDAELLLWLTTHLREFERLADATLPYMKPQGRAVHKAEVQLLIELLNQVDSVKHTLAGVVELKNMQKKKVIRMIRDVATCSKKSPTRDPVIIQGMQLICRPTEIDRTVVAPSVTAVVYPGFIEIGFDKKVLMSVKIYCRRTGDEEWEFLDYASLSPYTDKRPLKVPHQPEWREYYAVYVYNTKTVGQCSDIVRVVFGG
jgi:hypothetical protein